MVKRFAVFLIIFQSLLTLLHWIIFLAADLAFPSMAQTMSTWMFWTLIFLSFLFTAMTLVTFRYNNILMRCLYAAAASWIGMFVYLFFGSAVFLLVYPAFIDRLTISGAEKLFYLIVLSALATSVYGLINARIMRTASATVNLAQLPTAWRGKRAALVSDIHLGHILADGFARKVAARLESLKPDIIFIAGDFFDGVPADFKKLASHFARLDPAWGTYFVSGNHDEMQRGEGEIEAIKAAGIRTLNNEKVAIEGVQIIGLDYSTSVGPGKTEGLLRKIGVKRDQPSILLKHVPLNVDEAEAAGVSLQLSGHTHRGQQYPFRHLTSWLHKGFDYGLHRYRSLQILTSSGVGTWGPPMRVGTKSEIVIITFQHHGD